DGGYGGGAGNNRGDVPVLELARRSERADLPGPDFGEYVLQAAGANWRRGNDWADPDGDVQTGTRAATWSGGRGDRQYRGDCGGGCARDGSADQRRGGKEGERRGGGWGKAAGADSASFVRSSKRNRQCVI